MKKIFLLLLVFLFSAQLSFAKDYTIHFNGTKFHLLYSIKNKDFGGYLNEYYKKGETYNIWSELVAVHHFPNAYSPIDRVKEFKNYLGSMHVPNSLTFDDKKNTATIDFIMITEHRLPVILEFNIFKYEKSKKCGSVAIQYSKRYSATTAMQVEEIKNDFEKNRKKLIKKVEKLKVPELVTEDIDKCISAADIIKESESEKSIEENKISEKTEEDIISQNDETNDNQIEENDISNDSENIVSKENKLTDKNIEDVNTDKQTDKIIDKEILEESKTTQDSVKVTEVEENEVNDNTAIKEKTSANHKDISENNQQNIDTTLIPSKTKEQKNIKEVNYQIINTKDEYIAKPRTKKELKEEVKQHKLYNKAKKKEAKLKAKQKKKQAKLDAKNKKRAEKLSKKTYEISNNNSDLIAQPRTKKELKANNKRLKREAKERVKKAKKKLNNK